MNTERHAGAGKSTSPLTRTDVERLLNGIENAAQLDLRLQNLQHIDLSYIDLQRANLQEADLRAANLRGANLSEANLQGFTFAQAHQLFDAWLAQEGYDYNEQAIQAMWIGFAHRICDLFYESEPEE